MPALVSHEPHARNIGLPVTDEDHVGERQRAILVRRYSLMSSWSRTRSQHLSMRNRYCVLVGRRRRVPAIWRRHSQGRRFHPTPLAIAYACLCFCGSPEYYSTGRAIRKKP
jgi:hypothetical protein